jgi:beta-ribofuranosylaminobenzene 5'-phosphate synthase
VEFKYAIGSEALGVMIEVAAGARIHISLADMALASARAFAGVGFMIDGPKTRIQLYASHQVEWVGLETLDQLAQQEVRSLVDRILYDIDKFAGIKIVEHAPQHLGFGSKTTLRLCLVSGLHALFGVNSSRERQQLLSGRGGGSGIGVHGFFEGGVIWDAGHAREAVDALLPSGISLMKCVPPLMLRLRFPDHWRVGLCLPEGPPISGLDERAFFESVAPIATDDTLRAMAALYHGVLPSFRLADLDGLR